MKYAIKLKSTLCASFMIISESNNLNCNEINFRVSMRPYGHVRISTLQIRSIVN